MPHLMPKRTIRTPHTGQWRRSRQDLRLHLCDRVTVQEKFLFTAWRRVQRPLYVKAIREHCQAPGQGMLVMMTMNSRLQLLHYYEA